MAYFLQNFDFASYPIDIHLVLDFVFFKNLDGHFFVSYRVDALFDFSEGALAQRAVDDKVANLLDLFLAASFFLICINAQDELL